MVTPRKTRVLVVLAHLVQQGSERFTYEMLKALDRQRFHVELLTKRRSRGSDYYDAKIQALGIRIHRRLPIFLHYIRRFLPSVFQWSVVRSMVEAIHRLAARVFMGDLLAEFDVIDVIQIENYYLIQPLVRNNDKVVVHLMAAGFQYVREKPYADCRPGRTYRFVMFEPSFVEDYADAACRDAEVIEFPLALDLGNFPDLSACARIGPPYKIGMFVRISAERPVHGVLRAFQRVSRSSDARLIWFGRGNPAIFLPLIDELGIRDKVIFRGHSSSIEETLRTEGLSCVYTTGSGSLIGYSGVEVAAYGFPMLVWNQRETSHQGVLAATRDAIHTHHDPTALGDETLDLLRRPEALRAIGRALRAHVAEAYDIKRHIHRLEELFERVARYPDSEF